MGARLAEVSPRCRPNRPAAVIRSRGDFFIWGKSVISVINYFSDMSKLVLWIIVVRNVTILFARNLMVEFHNILVSKIANLPTTTVHRTNFTALSDD